DGAYGGVAALTDALKPMFRGIERADSVALDPHKWLYTPHSSGFVVVRGFHPLKIWVSLLAHGWDAYERRIANDVALARYAYDRAASNAELEPIGPPPVLSIACFRYVPRELRGDPSAEPYLNRLNERLMAELQLAGRVFPSNAVS